MFGPGDATALVHGAVDEAIDSVAKMLRHFAAMDGIDRCTPSEILEAVARGLEEGRKEASDPGPKAGHGPSKP